MKRAIPSKSSRETIFAIPSTWPVTIWPPSSSPIFSARSRLIFVPTRHCAAVVRARVSAAASISNMSVRPHLPPQPRSGTGGTGDGCAKRDALGRIGTGDAQTPQGAALLDGNDLAHIGDDAREHQAALSRADHCVGPELRGLGEAIEPLVLKHRARRPDAMRDARSRQRASRPYARSPRPRGRR